MLALQQIELVFSQMEGIYALIARLLYGTGMRLMERAQLRVKDVNLQRHEMSIRNLTGDYLWRDSARVATGNAARCEHHRNLHGL